MHAYGRASQSRVTQHDTMSHHRTSHALRWAYALAWIERSLSMLTLFVLARILGPEAFGLSAVAMALVGFLEILLESGIATAVTQRKDLEPEDLDSIFWFTMLATGVVTVLAMPAAYVCGTAMQIPDVAPVFAALSPLLLLRGVCVVQIGLARRELRFKALALRGTIAGLSGSAAGIGSAIAGAGVYSIVAQSLVAAAVAAVMLWKLEAWRPRRRFQWARARSFLGFSSGMLATQIADFLSRNTEVFAMGAFFGEAVLGVFRLASRAVNLAVEMLIRPVQAVAIPRFASLQSDPDALALELRRLARSSALAGLPTMAFVAMSADLVGHLLGDRWSAATSAIRILCLVGVAKSVSLLAGPLLIARGRTHLLAALSWLNCAINVLAVVVGCWIVRDSPMLTQIETAAWTRALTYAVLLAPIQLLFLSRVMKSGAAAALFEAAPGAFCAAGVVASGASASGIAGLLGAGDAWRATASASAACAATAVPLVMYWRKLKADGRMQGGAPSAEPIEG